MPYLRAQLTMRFAVGPSLTPPSPTSPSSVTPASARSLKSCSVMSGSMHGAPASTLTPEGRKLANCRCAEIAIALSPTTSRGRPGVWTSPAEIIVVTPPLRARVDPAELILPRCPVARDRVNMAIDQARGEHGSVGVDDGRRALVVEILGAADGMDASVNRDEAVAVENRALQHAGKDQADVSDHQLLAVRLALGHCFLPVSQLRAVARKRAQRPGTR